MGKSSAGIFQTEMKNLSLDHNEMILFITILYITKR